MIPGTVPVAGPVAPTSTGDTYPSHLAIYGKGGLRTVADNTERDAISADRREAGMLVYSIGAGVTYQLDTDLTTWIIFSIDVTDVMLKSVYDPNDDGIVTDSDQLQGQNGAFYLDRDNHTGTDEIADVNGLQAALDAKINSSLIGVANGVVPTNAGNTIDPAFLGIILSVPLEGWDANTNTPTLSDASGNANEYCFVTVAGTSDLGSGNLVCAIGNFIYHDGAKWNLVPTTGFGVNSITTALGLQTGSAIIDDTSYFDPSTDRNYVTDDEDDALNAANSPSATNPIATMDDLASVIVVGNGVFLPELFNDGQTLGDGTSRTLASLGYNNTTAGNYWTRVNSAYTIDVNTMTIDWIAWQEAFLSMEQQGWQSITTPSGRGYVFNQSGMLPRDQTAIAAGRRSLQWKFDFNMSKFTGNNIRIFDRYPANQAEANGLRLDYSYHFLNGTFQGGNTANDTDCAIRLGGTTHSTLSNIKVAGFGIPLDWQFCLETRWNNIKVENYGLYGVRLGNGLWSGAALNNAQSNIAQLNIIRFVNGSGKTPQAGLYVNGNQNITTNGAAFEGFNGSVHHVLYDNMLSTTTKYLLKMNDSYWEAAGASRAMIRIRSNSGGAFIWGWSAQGDVANLPVFIEAEGIGMPSQAPMFITVRDAPAYNLGYKFRQIQQHKWTVDNVDLNNTSLFTAPENWDTSVVGSSIPSLPYNYTPIL